MGRNKGKIVVEFATLEDLDRIIKSMAPDDNDVEDA
jgi:ParB family chromosome partitioning protein